jgi:hypothetical protein
MHCSSRSRSRSPTFRSTPGFPTPTSSADGDLGDSRQGAAEDGHYGILRFNFAILPVATATLAFWTLAALGTFNIVYGALCAMAQKDLKKLVAYSSISHMGYVMLGMAAFTTQGINGHAACSTTARSRDAVSMST